MALVGIAGLAPVVILARRAGRLPVVLAAVVAAVTGLATLRWVAAGALTVAALLVAATLRRAVAGGRALLIRLLRWVAALALVRVAALTLIGRAALVGVATMLRIALTLASLTRRRVTALVGRVLPTGVLAGLVLGTPIPFVVIVVGSTLSLASAVIRVVGHRLYSWFCGVRAVLLCWGRFAGGGVRVDGTTRAKLSGVQVRRLLESNDHITIRLPPLIMDVTLQVPGKCGRSQVRVSADLLVVGHAEGNEVVVGRQKPAARQLPYAGLCFSVQHGFDLLRHNRSAEHPRESVAHGRLKLALDAVCETHLIACLRRRRRYY